MEVCKENLQIRQDVFNVKKKIKEKKDSEREVEQWAETPGWWGAGR